MTEPLALSVPATAGLAADRWLGMSRATGLVGLVTFVLLFGPIIAVSTLGEPPFSATSEQARDFLVKTGVGWVAVAQAVTMMAAIGLVWFVVGLSLLLARAEGNPAWRSVVALASGMLLPAYVLIDASWGAAANRGSEIDPALAAYAFDVGNLGLANIWVAMGSFAVVSGWVILSTRMLGRWLGWWAVLAGAGLVACRFAWTSELWFGPYFAFWSWVTVVCVELVRGRVGRAGGQP